MDTPGELCHSSEMPPSSGYTGPVEYAYARAMRQTNTRLYRLAHWPIWIGVFFLAPGPLTFSLFAEGFGSGNFLWLAAVMAGTGAAGLRGQLPGVEPRPYILRFDEAKPNPLYRRVCYTAAWNAAFSFAFLNAAGLSIAAVTGRWYMRQLYRRAYPLLAGTILLLGVKGALPRAGLSTKGEGTERRMFYGAVWSVTLAQTALLALWKTQKLSRKTNQLKLGVFAGTLALVGLAARRGLLPRTRPILPGDVIVAD